MRFYLGTHEPTWLHRPEFVGVPLFVSHRRLSRNGERRTSYRPAITRWALDSGGFTELGMYGGWRTTAAEYARAARRYHDEIGMLDFASPQDWMCEPVMLERSGLTVAEHQRLTVDNFLDLMTVDPDLPWRAALQGYSEDDYLRCVDMYEAAGIDLSSLPNGVGVGSVCRRQGSPEIAHLLERLSGLDLRMHGYGVKSLGLRDGGRYLASSDSLAWSTNGRKNGIGDRRATPQCTHKTCANCVHWALRWRRNLLAATPWIDREPADLPVVAPIPLPRTPLPSKEIPA